MPYQTRSFPLVPMPAPRGPDVIDLYELSRRMKADKREDQAYQQQEDQNRILTEAMQRAKGDPDRAADWVMQAGHFDLGSAMRERSADIRKSQHDAITSFYKQAREGLGALGDALKPTLAAGPGPEAVDAYRTIMPVIDEIRKADPQVASIPLPEDPNDPVQVSAFARALTPIVGSAMDAARLHEDAIGKLDQSPEKDESQMEFFGRIIQTYDTGEELQDALDAFYAVYKTPQHIRDMIGEPPPGPLPPEWKMAIPARLGASVEAQSGPEPGTLASYMAKWARDHNTTPAQMTSAQERAARAEWSAAGREPDDGRGGSSQASGALTPTNLNTVLNWRWDEIRKVEADAAPTLTIVNEEEVEVPGLDAREKAARIRRVNEEFYKRLGVGPPPGHGMKLMKVPDGRTMWIPRDQFNEARRRGAILILDE